MHRTSASHVKVDEVEYIRMPGLNVYSEGTGPGRLLPPWSTVASTLGNPSTAAPSPPPAPSLSPAPSKSYTNRHQISLHPQANTHATHEVSIYISTLRCLPRIIPPLNSAPTPQLLHAIPRSRTSCLCGSRQCSICERVGQIPAGREGLGIKKKELEKKGERERERNLFPQVVLVFFPLHSHPQVATRTSLDHSPK
jgi:hypothetical protein